MSDSSPDPFVVTKEQVVYSLQRSGESGYPNAMTVDTSLVRYLMPNDTQYPVNVSNVLICFLQ